MQCESGVLRDETDLVRPMRKVNLAAPDHSLEACGTAEVTPSIAYRMEESCTASISQDIRLPMETSFCLIRAYAKLI